MTEADLRVTIEKLSAACGLKNVKLDILTAALRDALEGMEDMRPYVSDYFAEKWGHDGYIARARATLETLDARARATLGDSRCT